MRSHDVHVTCEGCVRTYHALLPHLTLQHDEVKVDKAEGTVCMYVYLACWRGGEEGGVEGRRGGGGGRRGGGGEEGKRGGGGGRRGGKEGKRGVHYFLLISVCE